MSRSIVSLGELGHTPMSRLHPADHFRLELAEHLTDLQRVVNRARMGSKWLQEHHREQVRYHLGRLHGCLFSLRALLIHVGGYEETYEWSMGVMNEADFLAYDYLMPEQFRHATAIREQEVPA